MGFAVTKDALVKLKMAKCAASTKHAVNSDAPMELYKVDSVIDIDPRWQPAVRKDVQNLSKMVVSVGDMGGGQKILFQCALKMEYVYLQTKICAKKKDARIFVCEMESAIDMGQ